MRLACIDGPLTLETREKRGGTETGGTMVYDTGNAFFYEIRP